MFTHCGNNLEKHVIEKTGSNTIMIFTKLVKFSVSLLIPKALHF